MKSVPVFAKASNLKIEKNKPDDKDEAKEKEDAPLPVATKPTDNYFVIQGKLSDFQSTKKTCDQNVEANTETPKQDPERQLELDPFTPKINSYLI